MFDFSADLGNCFFQAGQFGSQPPANLMCAQVILRLMLGTLQVVTHGFKLLESNIDRAVLAAGEKQGALTRFKILLNRSPSGSANAESGSGNMRGDLAIFQRMELFEFVETKGKHIVIQGLSGAPKQSFESAFITGFVSRI